VIRRGEAEGEVHVHGTHRPTVASELPDGLRHRPCPTWLDRSELTPSRLGWRFNTGVRQFVVSLSGIADC
jgi:hypothetical protein